MTYSILDGKLIEGNGGQVGVFVGEYRHGQPPEDSGAIPPRVFASAFGHKSSHFESNESFDLICYEPVDILKPEAVTSPVCIFMECDHMHFYAEDESVVTDAFREFMASELSGLTPGTLLSCFLSQRLSGDREKLEEMENSLNALEDEVLTGEGGSHYNRRFMVLRRHLVRIKRYYEQLTDLFEDLTVNENRLFDKRALKQFALLDGRSERLMQKVSGMLDYVSDIRGAYQAETDLRLNKTMQVLTIITVVVLPLTLIAGWYGMNLNMPEYDLPFAYPAVLILSAAVIGVSIWYFKRHKWF